MNTELYPVVTVEWADHYSDFEQGMSKEDIIKMVNTPAIRKTTGHLIYENKRQLALASTIDFDKGEYTFCEVFICMKKAIIERSDK